MQAVYSFVLALFLSTALVPPLGRIAGPLGLTDRPSSRKVHTSLIPRTGGIAIFLGALAPVLLWVPLRDDLRAFLVAAGLLFVCGVFDDRFNLDYRIKLLAQVLAALIVTVGGRVVIRNFPFVAPALLPPFVAVPFTVFVLVGITNALNLSDGLDGLAGGISLLAIGTLMLMAYEARDIPVVMVAMAVLGATLGFLRYNTFPARIFMGDSGSQFLGFTAGVLAVIVTQSSTHAFSPLVPVVLLGLPILDTLTVMTRRIAEGRSPFSADRTHIHHRLLDLGFTQYEAVATVYVTQGALVLLAFVLRYSSDAILLAACCVFVLIVLTGLPALAARSASLESRHHRASPIGRFIAHARETGVFRQYPYRILNLAVPVVLVAGALACPTVRNDVSALAAALLTALLLALSAKKLPFFFIERLTAYVAAAIVAFRFESCSAATAACGLCIHGFFVFLAAVTAVWVRFSSAEFKVTSLDILIVFLAAAVPTLGGSDFRLVGRIALESIVLFYAIEVILTERPRHWDLLRFGLLASLAILAVKGIGP